MKIKCGQYDVYACGSMIGYKDNPIEMTLTSGSQPFTFRFVFKKDSADKSERTEFVNTSKSVMEIHIINSNRAFGIGPLKPIEIGYLHNRKLYLAFRVYTSANSAEKLFHYTWYLGEDA